MMGNGPDVSGPLGTDCMQARAGSAQQLPYTSRQGHIGPWQAQSQVSQSGCQQNRVKASSNMEIGYLGLWEEGGDTPGFPG